MEPIQAPIGMLRLASLVRALPARHQECLDWFTKNAGRTVAWSEIRAQPQYLAILPKGIYKPAWGRYALSVKQTLKGVYPDSTPVQRTDGTWFWLYSQENPDEAKRDRQFTNLGLLSCHADRVPVGALRQVSGKPRVEYQVLGVAIVAGWNKGLFHLEGFSSEGLARSPGRQGELEDARREMTSGEGISLDDRSPYGEEDGRRRVLATIVARQGQPVFRGELLRQFNGACPVSGCNLEQALEAAHIRPYLGPKSNAPSNGLILRADLHTLFDLDLIAISPGAGKIHMSPLLTATTYAGLRRTKVRLPRCADAERRAELLEEHWRESGL